MKLEKSMKGRILAVTHRRAEQYAFFLLPRPACPPLSPLSYAPRRLLTYPSISNWMLPPNPPSPSPSPHFPPAHVRYDFESSPSFPPRADVPPVSSLFSLPRYNIDSSPTSFVSNLMGWYWCVQTLTSVGYGDIFPLTLAGRVVAVFATIGGLITLALPITIIGTPARANRHRCGACGRCIYHHGGGGVRSG